LTIHKQRNQNATIAQPIYCFAMPTNITLKNVPDEVYERLKASAEHHRRSLNSEAIVCLESVLMPQRMSVKDRIARARALRAELPESTYRAKDIDALKREGRR
jgi:plasmid stability protein